jgi:hypothetical protein
MAGVAKQIIGSFEDIGKDITRETVKVPGDVVGKALESLGTSSQKPQKGNAMPAPAKEPERPVLPRQWLAELAVKSKKPQEPTVQERLEEDKQKKNEKETKQAVVAQKMAPLPYMSQKAKSGDLYGVKQKKTQVEIKNARQD